MKITNEFTVHTPIDRAWQVLTDLEGIAPCMPGAQLTGVDGDVYRGKVKIKVGPVISEFAGTARFAEKDADARRAVIDAKGRDGRSAGNAAALVTAVLRPDGDSTVVNVDTDLKISGKLAQFGSGMIKEVSGKLLAQFVANLEAKLAADEGDGSVVVSGNPSGVQAAPAILPGAASTGAVPEGVDLSPAETSAGSPDAGAVTASAAASGTAPDAAVALAGDPVATTPSLDNVAEQVAQRPPVVPNAEAPDPGTGEPKPDGVAAVAAPGATKPAAFDPDEGPTTPAAGPDTARPAGSQPGDRAPVVSVGPDGPAGSQLGDRAPVVPGGQAGSQPGDRAPVVSTGPAGPQLNGRVITTEEPEPLDLLDIAGGSIYKRLIPVAAGAVVVGAVIVWLVSRR